MATRLRIKPDGPDTGSHGTRLRVAGRPSRPPAAPPCIDGQVDVAVDGGGITLVTTALLLGTADKSLLLLKPRHVGAGTTGGSAAKISLLQGTQLTRISRQHPRRVVGHYVTTNTEAQAWLTRFYDEHDVTTQCGQAPGSDQDEGSGLRPCGSCQEDGDSR